MDTDRILLKRNYGFWRYKTYDRIGYVLGYSDFYTIYIYYLGTFVIAALLNSIHCRKEKQ